MNLDKFKKRKWRNWFRVVHRDLGFFIFGLTVIYSVSGISLNHINDWNPSYIISSDVIEFDQNQSQLPIAKLIAEIAPKLTYKKHFERSNGSIRVFVKGGIVDILPNKNIAVVEVLNRRPFFYEFNFLHYNRDSLWVWFSDIFAAILIIVSISGLFLVKGKYGITKYGLYWTLLGILIPTVFLLLVI
jgi:hypothetical protein